MKDYGKQIIVSVIAAILVFGVGYALLSDTITVTGTASTTGTLDVEIKSATVTTNTGGSLDTDNTASISSDSNTVTIAVPKLEYPGASVTFTVNIHNAGSVDAYVKSITPTETYKDLTVTTSGIAINDTLAADANDSFTVTVTWDADATEGFTGKPFNINILFEQQV